MWIDLGNILLGTLLLLLGSDSLANGVAGLLARRYGERAPAALGGAFTAAVMPACALTVGAMLARQPDLALGGLIGGAIAQLGLMLGLVAVMAPLLARLKTVSWANPLLLGAIVLAAALGFDQTLGRVDGLLLLGAFAAVAFTLVRAANSERAASRALFSDAPPIAGMFLLALRIGIGLALIALGGWRLVPGVLGLATQLAVAPLIIGMLVLGPASALAGVSTALGAARRGHGEFALVQGLGGALGNLLLLLGALALWRDVSLPASLGRIEFPLLFALALAIYPMMRSDGELSRREGGVLLATFVLIVATEVWLMST